jgi:hypothetical protein
MMLTVTVISESKLNGAVTRGKLNLVDLAGSERLNKSGENHFERKWGRKKRYEL